MAKRKTKVVFKCFLCGNIVRKEDAFKVKYVTDVQFSPVSVPVQQESDVTLCRDCMVKAGYLSKKARKNAEKN